MRTLCIHRTMSSFPSIIPKVCIVGSGPAGFYFAQHLIKAHPTVIVDIYERLPVPFGLVRYGVAPDHPEVKNVINTFTKTAQNPRVNFLGNVKLGKDISMKQLQQSYHAVVLSYGAEQDKVLGIEGEKVENVISARRFVGWYNGLPEDKYLAVKLDCETVAVLGQGNVAVDVSRILLTSIDSLKKTDITSHALNALAESKVKKVVLIGRRGPLQVAFTIKEFREMLKLPGVRTTFIPEQMAGLKDHVSSLARPRKRLTELLIQASSEDTGQASSETSTKTFHPLFLRTPLKCIGSSRVTGIELAVNRLQGDTLQNQNAVATEARELLECGLVLRSIGYKSVQADPDIPFNHKQGCVTPAPGVYSAGWLSTGPVGVILSTMSNAFESANRVVQDMNSGNLDVTVSKPGSEHILQHLREKGIATVDFAGWEKIDKVEVERGIKLGKSREKIVDISEMLQIGGEIR